LIEAELTVGHLLLQEYEKLKAEQLARINTRDNLIYVTLASFAAGVAATLQAGVDFLLALPLLCVVLGWTYLANDQKISAIGRHIRTELAPRLETFLRTDIPLFTWETGHRSDRYRRLRKAGQLVVDLLTFCVPSLAAISAYWTIGSRGTLATILAAVELVAVTILGIAIVASADFARDSARRDTGAPVVATFPADSTTRNARSHLTG
jgi:hypothetical protein